ncbi:MAG: nucleoside monophosphate kinase [Patescibacteria group bacterium]
MNPQTFIFIGRSGAGKGTQAVLLQAYLEKGAGAAAGAPGADGAPALPVKYLQTGAEFRSFLQGDSYTQKTAKALSAKGALQPAFLAIYMWAKFFTEKLTGGEHLIIDGTPRKRDEAQVLDSVFGFYGRSKPIVLFMNISEAEAARRLAARQRLDDNSAEIRGRLAWYKTDVELAVEWYRTNPNYRFVEVSGEQSEAKIHTDIIAAVAATPSK